MEKIKTPEEILYEIASMRERIDSKYSKGTVEKVAAIFHQQFNISNEEIERECSVTTHGVTFMAGAKWMRDQIFKTKK